MINEIAPRKSDALLISPSILACTSPKLSSVAYVTHFLISCLIFTDVKRFNAEKSNGCSKIREIAYEFM